MKYLAIAAVSARQILVARGEALARAAFYVILLFAFSRLWSVMEAGGRLHAFSAAAFVWYVAITECVALPTGMLFAGIEEDVRSGDIAYRIARPASYVWSKHAEWTGEALVRFLFLVPVGVACAWTFAAGGPPDWRGLLLAVPLIVLAIAVMLVFQVAIGLSAFWFQEATPLFWIWQKLLFVFGGLMIPLEIYPSWMRSIAAFTPFEPLFHGCGSMAFGFDPAAAAWTALKLVLWGVAGVGLVLWLYRKGLSVMDVNGG